MYGNPEKALSSPLGADKEGRCQKSHPPKLSSSLSMRTNTLYKIRKKLLLLQELWMTEMRERTQGSGPSSFPQLVCASVFSEDAYMFMSRGTREQEKPRLTILQTLHVGGVFRKPTLHHARDVREGAGKGSLSWHKQHPRGCPWAAKSERGVLGGKPGGARKEWDSCGGSGWYSTHRI